MKKVKVAFWILIAGFFGLLIYQNQEFFLSKHSLGINLIFTEGRSKEILNAVLFAIFFVAGWLIAYFFGLFDRFKASRTIKGLEQTIKSHHDTVAQMKKEVEALKPSGTVQTMAMEAATDDEIQNAATETEPVQPPTA